jgi:hypothetical protein
MVEIRRINMWSFRFCLSVGTLIVLALWLSGSETVRTQGPPNLQPGLVRDADHPARHSYQIAGFLADNDPTPELFFVSGTEKLVIEFASASCHTTQGVRMHSLRLHTTGVQGKGAQHFLAPQHVLADPNGLTIFTVLTHPARIYIEPGTHIEFTVFPTTNAATIVCNIGLSGYLIAP